ncbi:beta-mannosidase [Algibacter lectus]|uniref:Beta-mannosidase n=2 Tax=Algibacter lectus TaxID=221126 RepID=A0A090VD26_9FLAO|nr:beta-mannosidase [Algibacter lectus]
MKMMLPGEGVKAGLHELPPEDIETLVWNAAQVPGDVYTDLWKIGAIDDPYFGRNSVKANGLCTMNGGIRFNSMLLKI